MRAIGANFRIVSRRRGRDRIYGPFWEVVYEGTPQAISTLEGDFTGDPTIQSTVIDEQPGKHRLVVRADIDLENGPGAPTVEFRQQPSRAHKSIFEPPYPYSNVTEDDVRKIREAINKSKTSAPTLSSAEADQLYELALQGVQFRTVYQPILQVVRVAHWSYVWPNDYANIGLVMDLPTVLSDIQAKTGGTPNFPLLGQTWPTPDFVYGYLFHMPSYDTSIGGKSTEVLEYEYGLWSTFLYDTV